ncbi:MULTISPECIES: lactococcin 972 family bacteriocin [unclassified Rathayibacter]|uniref:lactococcin 972 family bacteriocin n=1 Tax=unclassified Rathayibacter TaxID=2609250 RepID=UPI0006FD6FB0|nr:MULTISPECIES: lactococcin 972 family bacteriocin [unclassified Rathayibacter]KQQ03339.1 hypothetical protein ASF42_07335 [Rathayibacter sp. Leaf294]KQS11793.1 hypothetical protein ASG06_07335 [Rathayibacter sp. Leaf185]
MSLRTPGSRRSFLTGLALAGTILAAPAAAAAYTTSYPEGGTWIHGVSSGRVLSSYQHGSRWHRASVDNGTLYRSSCRAPSGTAAVSAPARPLQVDYAYYSFC